MTATFFTINISFKKIQHFQGVLLLLFQATCNQNWKGNFYLETQECFSFLKLAVSAAFKRTGYNRPVSLLLGK